MKMYKKPAIKTLEVELLQMIAESINGFGLFGTDNLGEGEIHGGAKEMDGTGYDSDYEDEDW
ncbi:MAG: hypothetical protein MJZ20_14135 [Bacteroidaceae bacterium]|nr:hypothetical protein [Bacteroidaceae bacterium]